MTESVAEFSTLINTFITEGDAAARFLAALHRLEINLVEVESALVEVFRLSEPTDLLDLRLTKEEMLSTLADFDFRHYFPVLLAEVIFENSTIPQEVPRRLDEQTVRRHGQVWRIYWTDADCFPSNPHAHNLASGLRLHLGTGGLFRKRDFVGKISRKDLLAIRGELTRFDLPPLSC